MFLLFIFRILLFLSLRCFFLYFTRLILFYIPHLLLLPILHSFRVLTPLALSLLPSSFSNSFFSSSVAGLSFLLVVFVLFIFFLLSSSFVLPSFFSHSYFCSSFAPSFIILTFFFLSSSSSFANPFYSSFFSYFYYLLSFFLHSSHTLIARPPSLLLAVLHFSHIFLPFCIHNILPTSPQCKGESCHIPASSTNISVSFSFPDTIPDESQCCLDT